jgi:hypothetical protein
LIGHLLKKIFNESPGTESFSNGSIGKNDSVGEGSGSNSLNVFGKDMVPAIQQGPSASRPMQG